MKTDITDTLESFIAVYPDGTVEGLYLTQNGAKRLTMGDDVQIIRLVPAEKVFIED